MITAITFVLLITLALYMYLKTITAPAIFVVTASVLIAIGADRLPETIRELTAIISPQYIFTDLIYGTVSVHGIVAPLLFSAVFAALTTLRLLNRREIRR